MKKLISILSIIANVLLAVSKVIIGYISKSSAILASGIDSFSDIFASIISYLGIRFSEKPADKKHPYGHYKIEVLTAFIISIFITISGFGIIYDSYINFFKEEKIDIGIISFGVMIFSIVINSIMSYLKIHFGKKENSLSLISDGIHSRIDVLTSTGVFVGLILVPYWNKADIIVALLIGLFIIKEGIQMAYDAIISLLDVSADPEVESKIKSIAKLKNIDVISLKTQKKGSKNTAELKISLPNNVNVKEATEISNDLREKMIKEIKSLTYITIEIQSHEINTGFYKSFIGRNFTWQRKGRFANVNKEKAEARGPNGYCVCKKCGYKIPHKRGIPCSTIKCPNCNESLNRE